MLSRVGDVFQRDASARVLDFFPGYVEGAGLGGSTRRGSPGTSTAEAGSTRSALGAAPGAGTAPGEGRPQMALSPVAAANALRIMRGSEPALGLWRRVTLAPPGRQHTRDLPRISIRPVRRARAVDLEPC